MSVESVIPSNHFIHSPPALSLSQRQSLFQWVSSSHQVAKVLELQLQHQSFQWMFRVDFSVDAPYHAKHCAGYWIMTSLTIGLWSEWSYPFLGLHLLPIFWGVVIDAQSSPCIMILAVLHRNLGCLSWTFIISFSPLPFNQLPSKHASTEKNQIPEMNTISLKWYKLSFFLLTQSLAYSPAMFYTLDTMGIKTTIRNRPCSQQVQNIEQNT